MRIRRIKRKGFTLIELLAVIVVLAVLAMITVPIVQDLITAARRTAFKTTAYGYSKAMANKCGEKILNLSNPSGNSNNVSNGDEWIFEYIEPSSVTIKLEDGHLVYSYDYTGEIEKFVAPQTGDYK